MHYKVDSKLSGFGLEKALERDLFGDI